MSERYSRTFAPFDGNEVKERISVVANISHHVAFDSLFRTIPAIGCWARCDRILVGVRSVCLVFEIHASKLLFDWTTLGHVSVLVGVISPIVCVNGLVYFEIVLPALITSAFVLG